MGAAFFLTATWLRWNLLPIYRYELVVFTLHVLLAQGLESHSLGYGDNKRSTTYYQGSDWEPLLV